MSGEFKHQWLGQKQQQCCRGGEWQTCRAEEGGREGGREVDREGGREGVVYFVKEGGWGS